MLRKYALPFLLLLLAALTLSAYNSGGFQPVVRNAYSLGYSNNRFVDLSLAGTTGGGDNFRIAHTWNGIYIPSMNITSLLVDPSMSLTNTGSSGDAANFRIAHTWNGIFIPSVDVTALLSLSPTSSSGTRSTLDYGNHVLRPIFADYASH